LWARGRENGQLYDDGFLPQVSALGVLMIGALIVLTIVVRKLGAKGGVTPV